MIFVGGIQHIANGTNTTSSVIRIESGISKEIKIWDIIKMI
jgi:hypothetical protein